MIRSAPCVELGGLGCSPSDYCEAHNHIGLEIPLPRTPVGAGLWLPDWFIVPLSIFQHNSPTHYGWETQTSTLKNVCCWDT